MAKKQLLLFKDVVGLGRQGDVVTAKPGFVRNFLLPQGLAAVADKNTLRMQEKLKQEREVQAAKDREESQKVAKELETVELKTIVKVDQEGRMYGSVTALDIVRLLEDQQKLKVEKRDVLLKQPFKKLGTHPVNIRLKEGVEASFKLHIEPEEPVKMEKVEEKPVEKIEEAPAESE